MNSSRNNIRQAGTSWGRRLFGCCCLAILAGGATRYLAAQNFNPADILNGQRYMKQTEDVSFISVYNTDYDFINVDVITYFTSNSQFTSGTPSVQQTITSTDNVSNSNQLPTQSAVGVASGRMFNTANDQFVVLNPSLDLSHNPENDWMFHYYDPPAPDANPPHGSSLQLVRTGNDYRVPFVGGTSSAWVVMGNFRGDGLKEAFGVFANVSGNGVDVGMQVLGAQPNGNDPPVTDQVMVGPLSFSSSPQNQPQNFISFNQNSVVVGDFNGDGRDEVAIIMADVQTINFYSVDPNSYAISPMSPASIKLSLPVYRTKLVSGRFVNANRVDLVALGSDAGSDNLLRFEYINTQSQNIGAFDPRQENPQNVPTQPYDTGAQNTYFAQALPLIAPGSQTTAFGPEQLVMASQYRSGQTNFWVGDFFVNKYAFTQIGYTDLGSSGCTLGMQAGNFDHQTSSGAYNPGEQIAFLYNKNGCMSGSPSLFTFSLTVPQNLQPVFQTTNWLNNSKSNITVSASGNTNAYAYPVSFDLAVADVQGRSQLLGAPLVVTIPKQTQPDVVLGMPPMQVDYIVPPNPSDVCQPNTGNGTTTPCVADISYEPTPVNTTERPFTTAFSLTSGTSQKTYSNATTSWGLSTKTSVGVKIKFNDLEENASLNIKDTAASLYKSTVANMNSSLSTASNTVTASTTTDDELFFTERDLTVYYYPVLGYADPNSNDAPIYVEFSVPSNMQTTVAAGATQDWYQPVQEPGNVLSYPWSTAQLQSGFSNALLPVSQTQNITCALPGPNGTSFAATWATSSGNSQSLGTVSSFSNDLSVSGSEGAGVSGVDAADVTFGFDLNASTSVSSLNVETATVDQSTGVTLTVPALNNFDGDSYYLANFILGEGAPAGTQILQSLTPSITENGQTSPTDQTTHGPLFVNYIADAVPQIGSGSCGSTSGQSQWQAMYQLPDVGFNHPQRWAWQPNSPNMGVSFNAANPSNPVSSHFYHMKGLFITSPDNVGSGPSLTTATAGDQLELSARVYNFSLKDTDDPKLAQPAATIHVDFYGQTYGDGNVTGYAFRIGQAVLTQPIPGYKSQRHQGPNWVMASVPWNTDGWNPGPMVFWAVVWMEDANGNLVQEITGHGLTQIPVSFNSIAQAPIEPYSNNVGIYGVHTQFQLLPAPAPGAPQNGALPNRTAVRNVKVSVEPKASLDSDVDVLASLEAPEMPVDSMSLSYFDGNPLSGGKLFDHQIIHHIDPNSTYVHRASFQVLSCGVHTIFAEAFSGSNAPVISQGATVKVTLDPIASIEGMNRFLQGVQLSSQFARGLALNLQLAQSLFEKGETGRGIGSLQVFAHVTDAVAGFSGARAKQQLAQLKQQATVINSCVGGAQ